MQTSSKDICKTFANDKVQGVQRICAEPYFLYGKEQITAAQLRNMTFSDVLLGVDGFIFKLLLLQLG
jgi:hypothetical protein